MPKHFFFDLDKTLTSSRSPMALEHRPIFEKLCRTKDVVVVTGGMDEQIKKQLPFKNTGLFYVLSQQGNFAVHRDGTMLWQEVVSPEQERTVRAFADVLTADLNLDVKDKNDLFENRGSLLAYSTLGFHEDNAKKYAYDPDQSKRRALLERHAEELKKLRAIGIDAMPAGTTTIDFILAGKHKGYNITRLLDRLGWNKDDCIYVGDELFKGGNDESVLGVIPTKPVTGPDETFAYVALVLV